jgi:predicted outer membrane protein
MVVAMGVGAAPAWGLPDRVRELPVGSLEHPEPRPEWAMQEADDSPRGLASREVELLLRLHHHQVRQIGHARLAEKRARTKGVRAFARRVKAQATLTDRLLLSFLHKRHVSLGAPIPTVVPRFEIPEALLQSEGRAFDGEVLRVLIDEQGEGLVLLTSGWEETADPGLKALLGKLKKPLLRQRREAQALLKGLPSPEPRRRPQDRAEAEP